jgi:hypothetical protein
LDRIVYIEAALLRDLLQDSRHTLAPLRIARNSRFVILNNRYIYSDRLVLGKAFGRLTMPFESVAPESGLICGSHRSHSRLFAVLPEL